MSTKEILEIAIAHLSEDKEKRTDMAKTEMNNGHYDLAFQQLAFAKGIEYAADYLSRLFASI